ncbi:MAG: M1 family metallopeptidase [Gemmatimonadota bacterium]|nr:M1 family metallopeptidase [Gemmatimonadota bacterium]
MMPTGQELKFDHARRRIARIVQLLIGFSCVPLAARAQGGNAPFGNAAVWHWAPSRSYHVLNYRLELRFDEPHAEVFGDEIVTLRPFAAGLRRFYLNSAGLTIDSVWLNGPVRTATPLRHAADGSRLWITLDRGYGPESVLSIRIRYHGAPRTGLFFVNPTPANAAAAPEVYSQGEPELNHYWFPCWDYPNDMATSETITTVPEGQRVVSNGRLARVTHGPGTVTYDWVEGVPHSSYLISIAVGPWREISDHAGPLPVDYYVPRGVSEAAARRSFRLTPDMIGFFGRATGVPYPYEQYAQTTVHDYLFGGQENVSATTLTDHTLHDARADADFPSTALVAHELGQEWFGDYVQGRDWADIWLNEGFATYMEALYTQYHDGNDAFRYEMSQDQAAARAQDRTDYLRPIVDRHYDDPLDMFDAITHEKGAAVLDMLRYVVDGPAASAHPASQRETLFRALRRYLTQYHTHTVVTGELGDALRAYTGLELGWFFREWVFRAGTPSYRVSARYDSTRHVDVVRVAQVQTVDSLVPLFRMPVELAFHGPGGESATVQVGDSLAAQEFDVPLAFAPAWVDFDPDDFIDKTLDFPQPLVAVAAMAERDPAMMSRRRAAEQLGAMDGAAADARVRVLAHVLRTDGFYGVRAAAAASLARIGSPDARTTLLEALGAQPDSRVRVAAATALAPFAADGPVYAALVNALRGDSSYAVEAAAARGLGRSRVPGAEPVLATDARARPDVHVLTAVLAALAATRDPRAADVLLDHAQPGVPEVVRGTALEALAAMRDSVPRDDSARVAAAARDALGAQALTVRLAGEELVGAFGLAQFRDDVARDARAPLVIQRRVAQGVLHDLDAARH